MAIQSTCQVGCSEDKWNSERQDFSKFRSELAEYLLSEEDWDKAWDLVAEEYDKNVPSWEELYRAAKTTATR